MYNTSYKREVFPPLFPTERLVQIFQANLEPLSSQRHFDPTGCCPSAVCRWATFRLSYSTIPTEEGGGLGVQLRVSELENPPVWRCKSALIHSLTRCAHSPLLTPSSRIPPIRTGSSRSHTCHIPEQSCTPASHAGRVTVKKIMRMSSANIGEYSMKTRSVWPNSSSPEQKMDRVSHREPQTA